MKLFDVFQANFASICHIVQPIFKLLTNQNVRDYVIRCFAEIKIYYAYSIPTVHVIQ